MNPLPESHRRTLNPVIAKIQLDVEKLDTTSPDLAPAVAVSRIQAPEHSVAAADVEMGEPAMLSTQPKDVSSHVSTRSNGHPLV